jgi:hypothetical protein
MRLFGRAVAALQLVTADVAAEMYASCHAHILQVPSKTWYEIRKGVATIGIPLARPVSVSISNFDFGMLFLIMVYFS